MTEQFITVKLIIFVVDLAVLQFKVSFRFCSGGKKSLLFAVGCSR